MDERELRIEGNPLWADLAKSDGIELSDRATDDALNLYDGCASFDDVLSKVNAPKTKTKISEAALEKVHRDPDGVFVRVIVDHLSKVSTWSRAALEDEVRDILASK